ncbi:MAG: YgaP family membrane protein [Bacillota bacterium]
MKQNVGKVDQAVRYIVAIVFVVLAIVLDTLWLLIPAVILAFTAAVNFCGLYKLFGINTCKINTDDK